MKKTWFIVSIIALITCLTGIPQLIDGISQRGFGGVNYGRILFPFLISLITFVLSRKQHM